MQFLGGDDAPGKIYTEQHVEGIYLVGESGAEKTWIISQVKVKISTMMMTVDLYRVCTTKLGPSQTWTSAA